VTSAVSVVYMWARTEQQEKLELTQLKVQTNALFGVLRERNITGSPTPNIITRSK
jgi:hypothetical protein